MSIAFTDTMKKVWDYLTAHGMTEAGAAGMMGNMYAESGIIPNRVEILCLKRIKEYFGTTYTDATYTAAVDSGKITRARFLNPLPGKVYGYGYCQWTSTGRKAGLYDLCKSKGVSIGDSDTQLEWLMKELKESFSGAYKTLTQTKDILTASNAVLQKFEMPADTSTAIRQTRYNYAKEIYTKYASTNKSTTTATASAGSAAASTAAATSRKLTESEAIAKVLEIAQAEVGYLEKANGNSLDDKTANAGSANFTKYWRDIYPAYQAQAWCACFVSWCFMKAFGLDAAKAMLKHWPFVYCPTLAAYTDNKTPKVGSIVLFFRSGTYAHTGIVTEVTATTISTIEGNTSGASGIVPNGGGVCAKKYTRSTLSNHTKYFMPDYALAAGASTASGTSNAVVSAAKATDSANHLSGGLSKTVQWEGMVTASSLNVRSWAGTEYAKIKSVPTLPKGSVIGICDTVTDTGAQAWYYAEVAPGVYGFVCGRYVVKA